MHSVCNMPFHKIFLLMCLSTELEASLWKVFPNLMPPIYERNLINISPEFDNHPVSLHNNTTNEFWN